MKKHLIFSFFVISILNLSCFEKRVSEESDRNSMLIETPTKDSLTFSSAIGAIFQDSKSNYWFGSQNDGLCLYDGNNFLYFTVKDGLPDNQIRSVQEDRSGNIWIATAKGVARYYGLKIITYNQAPTDIGHNRWGREDSDLWFTAGNNEGVYRYDGITFNYLAFPITKANKKGNVYFVTDIAKGEGIVWIATYSGVFGYDGQDFTIINDETLGIDSEVAPLHIRSILEDSKGRLWIGNNGIGLLMREGGNTVNFSEDNNLIHPASGRRGDKSESGTLEHVFAIEEDHKGNIWFSDRDTGIWRYDGKSFTNFTIDSSFPSIMARTIYKDPNNQLLVGASNGRVYKFNGNTFDKMF